MSQPVAVTEALARDWTHADPPAAVRRLPGLSETLEGQRTPITCQACGFISSTHDAPTGNKVRWLTRWLECDPDDRKTDVVVVLCNRCADRLISRHWRFYHQLAPNQQHPATHVRLCMPCRWRDGLTCTSPLRLARGGPGLRLEQGQPATFMACGSGRGGRRHWTGQIWPAVTGCPGFEPRPADATAGDLTTLLEGPTNETR